MHGMSTLLPFRAIANYVFPSINGQTNSEQSVPVGRHHQPGERTFPTYCGLPPGNGLRRSPSGVIASKVAEL